MKTFKEDLAIEVVARFIGNSRGLPIEKRGFIDGALYGYQKAIDELRARNGGDNPVDIALWNELIGMAERHDCW